MTERRSHFRTSSRYAGTIKVRISRVDEAEFKRGGKELELKASDLGVGGVFVLLDPPEEVGSAVVTQLRVPGSQRKTITLQAKVRWVRAGPEPGMGIQFSTLTPEERLTLHDFLASLTKEE